MIFRGKALTATRGCKDTGTWRCQPSPFALQSLCPTSLPSACLLLRVEPSADSWACFSEAPEKALLWASSSSQSLNQNQPLSLIQVSKLQAGQETSAQGAAVHTCLSFSQAPGAAFQGLLQSQLREALEGDGTTSLP